MIIDTTLGDKGKYDNKQKPWRHRVCMIIDTPWETESKYDNRYKPYRHRVNIKKDTILWNIKVNMIIDTKSEDIE